MTYLDSKTEDLPLPSLPDTTRRSQSVRLSQSWIDGDDIKLMEQNTGDPIIDSPPPIIAFFPLPTEDEMVNCPPSPHSPPLPHAGSSCILRKSYSSSEDDSNKATAPSLSIFDAIPKTLTSAVMDSEKLPSSTDKADSYMSNHNDNADDDGVITDEVSDDKLSVGTVASREFSEGMADEIWEDVPMGQPDDILGIAAAFQASTDPRKVNVCVGAYRDDEGKPWVLPSVRVAEQRLWNDVEPKEYLPIEGDLDFLRLAMEFAYGPDMPMDHLAAVQTLSGTGACRLGGEFLARFWPNHPIFLPDPTWGNHINIFMQCGLDVRRYRWFHKATRGLDLRGLLRDLNRAPDGSIVLLHACAHNPTGCDPTIEEWKQIVSLCSRKQHVVFFDSAYQGFASGDAEADAQPFRYAVAQHIPILLAQSFAKNFGLYGERVGTLSVVCGDPAQKARITSELRCLVRPMYSSPPRHGSSIVKTILADKDLTAQYREECAHMAHRIRDMRKRLTEALFKVGSPHDWSHITEQIGMFAFTGLTANQCKRLTDEYAIYLTVNGRISMAGLNSGNLEYMALAMHAVTKDHPLSE